MCAHSIEILAALLTGIGTILLALVAVWGDLIRYWLAGAQLNVRLNDSCGNFGERGDKKKACYFHVIVRNRRLWSPARDVRVRIEQLKMRQPDDNYIPVSLVYALPLWWTPKELQDIQRTIATQETCDLGNLVEGEDRFRLATAYSPLNVQNYVKAGEAIRVRIVASGQNVTSSAPLSLEIAWDGKFPTSKDDVPKHLVVKQVA